MAGNFRVMVDLIPPYTYQLGQRVGESDGVVIEIVEAALQTAGMTYDKPPRQLPWRRAQQEAAETPGALIFPFARTPLRETHWQWIGVVIDEGLYIYTNTNKALSGNLEELARLQRIGVLAGGAPHSLAIEHKLNFETAANEMINFNKLALNRVDAVLSQGFMAKAGLQCATLRAPKQSPLPQLLAGIRQTGKVQPLPLWLATSLKTPEADVLRLRHALESFRTTASYKLILKRYLSNQVNHASYCPQNES